MPLPMINDLAKKGKKSPQEVEKSWQEAETSIRKSGSNLPDEEVYKRTLGSVKSNLGINEEDDEGDICPNCNGEGCRNCKGMGTIPTEVSEESTTTSDIAAKPERLGSTQRRIEPDGYRSGLPVFEVEEIDFIGATKIRRDGSRYSVKNEKVKQYLTENGYRKAVVLKSKDRYFILK